MAQKLIHEKLRKLNTMLTMTIIQKRFLQSLDTKTHSQSKGLAILLNTDGFYSFWSENFPEVPVTKLKESTTDTDWHKW